MGERITVRVNGNPIGVSVGTVVAAAVAQSGLSRFRDSVLSQPRGPLCGMGICMECRVTINGRPHCRSCLILCQSDMEIWTSSGDQNGRKGDQ
jgi:sarcosine oxidase subunit alpha